MTHKRTARKEKSGHSHDLDEQLSHSSASSPHTLVFVMSALKPSLLRLLTAHDAAGSRQIGGAEMEEHKKVSGLVTGSKAMRSVVVCVAAVCIHTPPIWTLWHGEKPNTLTIRLLQRTKSPQKRIAGC